MDTVFHLQLMIGIFLGFVCIMVGMYLLLTRGRKGEHEVSIKYFGTLKTTETSIVLIFIGLALSSFSGVGYMQEKAKSRIVANLETSESLLSFLLTPSLMKEKDFRNYVKALPKKEKDAIIVRVAKVLWNKFHEVTDIKDKDFVASDFDKVDDITAFITELDLKNGHALYYKGEVKRLLKDRDRFRENFFRYLDIAASLKNEIPTDIEAEICYKLPGGYCRQRTGWILHLLANDLYQEGLQENDINKKREIFECGLRKAQDVWRYFPSGFIQSKYTKSTKDLEKILKGELASLSINRNQ